MLTYVARSTLSLCQAQSFCLSPWRSTGNQRNGAQDTPHEAQSLDRLDEQSLLPVRLDVGVYAVLHLTLQSALLG